MNDLEWENIIFNHLERHIWMTQNKKSKITVIVRSEYK